VKYFSWLLATSSACYYLNPFLQSLEITVRVMAGNQAYSPSFRIPQPIRFPEGLDTTPPKTLSEGPDGTVIDDSPSYNCILPLLPVDTAV
jgi:hypothetical protein